MEIFLLSVCCHSRETCMNFRKTPATAFVLDSLPVHVLKEMSTKKFLAITQVKIYCVLSNIFQSCFHCFDISCPCIFFIRKYDLVMSLPFDVPVFLIQQSDTLTDISLRSKTY